MFYSTVSIGQNNAKLIVYYSLSRKAGELILSGIVSIILINGNYTIVMMFMMILSIIYYVLMTKIKKELAEFNN